MGLLRTVLNIEQDWGKWVTFPMSISSFGGMKFLLGSVEGDIRKVPCSLRSDESLPRLHERLPVEFFNWELADIDPFDDDEIARFCSKWGVFHCPAFGSFNEYVNFSRSELRRECPKTLLYCGLEHAYDESGSYEEFREKALKVMDPDIKALARGGKDILEESYEFWSGEAEAFIESQYLRFAVPKSVSRFPMIGIEEVRRSIINLQEIAHFFPAIDRMECEDELVDLVEKWFMSEKRTSYSPQLNDFRSNLSSERPLLNDTSADPYVSRLPQKYLDELNIWFRQIDKYFGECLWPLTERPIFRHFGVHLEGEGAGRKAYYDDSDKMLDRWPFELSLFGLQEAVCLQLFFELNDGSPWHQCQYDKCGLFFKYQRSKHSGGYHNTGGRSDTKYCCRNHSVYATRSQSGQGEEKQGNVAEPIEKIIRRISKGGENNEDSRQGHS